MPENLTQQYLEVCLSTVIKACRILKRARFGIPAGDVSVLSTQIFMKCSQAHVLRGILAPFYMVKLSIVLFGKVSKCTFTVFYQNLCTNLVNK